MRAAAFIAVMLAACGGQAVPPVQKGVLLIHCAVSDAEVVIDDSPVGSVAELPGGVRLPVGQHRLELRHDRYHTRYVMVTVAAGPAQTVDVTLAEALP
jgi:hypothetical protein